MYRELLPLRQALSAELKANLPPAGPGIDPEHLLQSYLDRLTMHVGCDVADQTFALMALDGAGQELGHRLKIANDPSGFERAWVWMDNLRAHHRLRIIVMAMETSGVYYWAWWDFLAGRPNLARVLYNPRTTEHMTEVLSKKVRNELVHNGGNLLGILRHGKPPNYAPDVGESGVFAHFSPHLGVMSTVDNRRRICAELY